VTTLLKQGVCANAPNARRKAACEQANGLRLGTQPPAPIFKGKPMGAQAQPGNMQLPCKVCHAMLRAAP
jgi:hypothetical protein